MPRTFVSEGEKLIENMIVAENSPLGPMLTFGCTLLLERGYIDTLDEKWMGKAISSYNKKGGGPAAYVLSIGQVMLGFVFMCTAMGVSLIVLIVEVLAFLWAEKYMIKGIVCPV